MSTQDGFDRGRCLCLHLRNKQFNSKQAGKQHFSNIYILSLTASTEDRSCGRLVLDLKRWQMLSTDFSLNSRQKSENYTYHMCEWLTSYNSNNILLRTTTTSIGYYRVQPNFGKSTAKLPFSVSTLLQFPLWHFLKRIRLPDRCACLNIFTYVVCMWPLKISVSIKTKRFWFEHPDWWFEASFVILWIKYLKSCVVT